MAIAVVATLLIPGMGNWGLIILGVAIGTAVGIPAARQVKMTAMPQMVALFNGVGGGAVALIAWVEFRQSAASRMSRPTWRSSASSRRSSARSPSGARTSPSPSCRRSCPAPDHRRPRAQQFVNLALLLVAVACAVGDRRRARRRALMIALLLAAAVLGNFVVLPIGGADMPVVISLLNAFTGLARRRRASR